MPSNAAKLSRIRDMIETAESNLRLATQLLNDMVGDGDRSEKYNEMAAGSGTTAIEGDNKIIEGVFDGQNMIGPQGKAYPIAANYASKSKLIPGDMLKLTVRPDGSFIYKQIGPVDRKRIKGTLTYEDGQYKVLAEDKTYNVLLASVTYFKADPGDEITLIVPEKEESEWGAIENVIPKIDS